MSADSYPYADGDPIVDRNTYFYSPSTGSAFLTAWRISRDKALGDLAIENDGAPPLGLTESAHELDSLIDKDSDDPVARKRFELIVKRFELSKRVYGAYDANGKPVDLQDFRNLDRYLLLAEALDRWYRSTLRLQYLNSLLKCLDSLTALRAKLNGPQSMRLARVIQCEREHVSVLALERGIDLR